MPVPTLSDGDGQRFMHGVHYWIGIVPVDDDRLGKLLGRPCKRYPWIKAQVSSPSSARQRRPLAAQTTT
jgi:hypothetical protein